MMLGLSLGITRAPTRALGPELVTNGGFSADIAGWTAAGNASLSHQAGTGRIRVARTDATSNPRAIQTLTLEIGATYAVSCDFLARSGTPTGRVTINSTPSLVIESTAPPITFAGTFVANATSIQVQLVIGGASGATNDWVEFDNVSVRRVI